MPNHIQNNLAFDCDDIRMRQILETIKAEEGSDQESLGYGTIDFNKLIPRPAALDIEDGSRTSEGVSLCLTKMNPNVTHYGTPADKLSQDDALELYHKIKQNGHLFRVNPALTADEITDITKYNSEKELIDLGNRAIQNVRDYGAPTWYGWSIKNWGTKWNSYSNSYNDETKTLSFQTAWGAPHEIVKKLSEMFPDVTIRHGWADENLGANCGVRTYLDGDVIHEYIPEGKEALEFSADTWGCDLGDVCMLLNATETDYIDVEEDEFELVEFEDKQILFSNERLTRKDIPQGLFCYDVRQSDDQTEFCSIERYVKVNHGGTIITKEPLNFGESDHIPLTYDNGFNFLGDYVNFADFISGNYEQEEVGGMTLE